jgi:glutathione S-transferase
MQLIGMLDSPYVRRVAISMQMAGLAYQHRPLSVFRDFEVIQQISPLVKVPTLVLDDGRVLVDSTLILEHLEDRFEPGRSLVPDTPEDRLSASLWLGTILVVYEKTVFLIYERTQRPAAKRHQPWIDRTVRQLQGALEWLESRLEGGDGWLFGERPLQADISLAVAWAFVQLRAPGEAPVGQFPRLAAFSARAEALEEFRACPLD